MDYVPINSEWLARLTSMPHTERSILLLAMQFICTNEMWLPIDRTACRRICNVLTRDEQRAFDRVMTEHFDITEQGRVLRNRKALHLFSGSRIYPAVASARRDDSVTAASTAASRQNVASSCVTPVELHKARQKRYRERIEELRAQAIEQGHSPRKNASMRELLSMLDVTLTRDADVTPTSHQRPSRAYARPEYPVLREGNTAAQQRARTVRDASLNGENGAVLTPVEPTAAGLVAAELRRAGLQRVNPSHPGFVRLVAAGAGQELVDAVPEALDKGEPFSWLLRAVEGRREDAARRGAVAAKRDSLGEWAGPEFMALVAQRGGLP